jgi:carbon-monoxide dehydrogenase large subunit
LGVTVARSYIGASLKRVEDPVLVRGAGRYVDDLREPGLLHLVFVRSPHGHARIVRIDPSAALALPGVVAALSAADLGDISLPTAPPSAPGAHIRIAPPLARDVVRFVGEPVAAVVAESRYLAEDAARLVEVEYDPLPAAGRIEEAHEPGAPRVHADLPDNVCFQTFYSKGDVAGAFERAALRVSVRLRRHRVAGVPIEPRGVLVRPEPDGGLTAWSSAQSAHRLRDGFASSLGIDRDKVRVIIPDVGGAFGVKIALYREDLVLAVAARLLGRPVKWISTRMEDLLSTQHARDQLDEAEGAFDAEGHLLAIRLRTFGAVGAYTLAASPSLFLRMIYYSAGPYRVPALEAEVTALFTNSNPTGALRGALRPEATTLGERLMGTAARRLGIDQAEIRRRNFVQPDQFPYTNPGGTIYDSGNYPALLEHALELAHYDALIRERDARRRRGELVGVGLATFVEMTGFGPEIGRVVAAPDGTVTAYVGSSTQGQAHRTVFPQVVATQLGVPYESVRLVQGDTAFVPEGTGTFGSRSMVVGGGALAQASTLLKERALELAAEALETSPSDLEWVDGAAQVKGSPAQQLSLSEIARVAAARAGGASPPAGAIHEGLEADTTFAIKTSDVTGPEVMASGAYLALVSVDRDTGRVRVEKLTAVDDSGVVVNPMVVEGQIHGSVAHGLGEALFERMVYDADGQVLTGSLLDYPLPTAHVLPTWTTGHVETPSPLQPFGAKGAGEAGNIGVPPTIVNAVLDALSPLGITSVDVPLHDERIWRLIHEAETRQAAGPRDAP